MYGKLGQTLPLLLVVGCLSSPDRGRDAGPDAGSDATGAWDIGSDPVAIGPDTAQACDVQRADFVCFNGAVIPDQRFVFQLGFLGGSCCWVGGLSAYIDEPTRSLFLRSSRCDAVGCGCTPSTLITRPVIVPPLAEGAWQVYLNDQPAFPLEVRDEPRGSWCASVAVPAQEEICTGDAFAAEEAPIHELCVNRRDGQLVFEHSPADTLGCAHQRGPCLVEPIAESTLESTTLHVRSFVYDATCEESCILDDGIQTYSCPAPADLSTTLPFQVFVQDELALAFSWEDLDDGPICTSMP